MKKNKNKDIEIKKESLEYYDVEKSMATITTSSDDFDNPVKFAFEDSSKHKNCPYCRQDVKNAKIIGKMMFCRKCHRNLGII